MVRFSKDRLNTLVSGFQGKRIAVVGDLMLDRYFWGAVARISPEAPVPVVEIESQSTRLGGAANVANNVASLGGHPFMIGVIGDDEEGRTLRTIIGRSGFSTAGVLVDASRPTTTKTRVIAHHQHVVRIDHETKDNISPEIQNRILSILEKELSSVDAIVLQDYNKGVIVKDLIHRLVDLAKKNGRIITVDPKFNNFFEYKGVTVFKPNRKESEEALGRRLDNKQSIERAGKDLLEHLSAENILLTLGENGMSLFEKEGTITHVSTQAKKVSDVSGAGDTVISTLTMALVAGATIREASSLANYAGGVVCGEVGIVPIQQQDLIDAVMDNHRPR